MCLLRNTLVVFCLCVVSPWAVAVTLNNPVVNTYVKGSGDVNSGVSVIGFEGSFRGADTAISAGATVLLMQMQGAQFDATNTDQYGDGIGSGASLDTTPTSAHGSEGYAGGLISQTAGTFEYATVLSVDGTELTLSAPINHSYFDSGEANWQIVVVPQYDEAVLGVDIEALRWDGNTGGVVAFNVDGTLDFNGRRIDVSAMGFRGGVESDPNVVDDDIAAVAAATSVVGGKGEGVAGTPARVFNGTDTSDVVPASTLAGGDFGRGAPANAGGGAGPHNSGGGGGSNAGRGGSGAQGYVGGTPVHFGGYGGQPIFAGANLGGGGGSGEANNGTVTHGGVGGGIIILRAASAVDSIGTLDASGGDGLGDNGPQSGGDGAGGGGAGGSVMLYFENTPSLPNLTVDVSGGNGGNADIGHGGGGGGGGGLVSIRADDATINVSGGARGANVGDAGVESEPGGDGLVRAGDTAFLQLNTDFGDAPRSYGTVSGDNAAFHYFADYDFDGLQGANEQLKLGALIDGEAGGNPSAAADSDDTNNTSDEDGLSAVGSIDEAASSHSIAASQLTVTNTFGVSATLHAWIDFDNSGSFDSDEHASISIASGLQQQSPADDLEWPTLPGFAFSAGDTTYLRLRLTNDADLDSSLATGEADNGEVEDYQIAIVDQAPFATSITREVPLAAQTNAEQVIFQISFSESVENVDASDFELNGDGATGASIGAVSPVTGSSNASFLVTVDVAAVAEGSLNLDIAAANNIQETGGGSSLSSTLVSGADESYTLDNTAPNIAINNVPANTGGAFTATFEFSETVTGFDIGDITVANGSASNFSAVDGSTYTATITPSNPGTVTIDVASGVASDAAGNNNTAASQASSTYDNQAPSVSILNVPATSNAAFTATFEFSETVTGFEIGDITVANGSASNFSAVDGNTYTATITPSNPGTVTIDVASGVASDAAGNNNTVASQASSTYDNQAPSVSILNVPATSHGFAKFKGGGKSGVTGGRHI